MTIADTIAQSVNKIIKSLILIFRDLCKTRSLRFKPKVMQFFTANSVFSADFNQIN